MNVLEVRGLRKSYPGFCLQDVSFSVAPGSIMGFIGRNGAGKTTTLKSLLHIVHPDSGSIRFFGLDFDHHEDEIKQRIGYAGGAVDFYKRKPIRALAQVTGGFYENWDEAVYRRWLDAFSLDESMTPLQLSEGMRVKLSLTLALSHHAELLILDEPTSGLDPVSRDELTELFRAIVADGTRSILFSTHITSDLEKCASHITFIKDGAVIHSGTLDSFRSAFADRGSTLEDIIVSVERRELDESAII